jgi:hypothetical protein
MSPGGSTSKSSHIAGRLGALVLGEVIENRGGIGLGGKRLLRVHVGVPTTAAMLEFEIRAADVQSAARLGLPAPSATYPRHQC